MKIYTPLLTSISILIMLITPRLSQAQCGALASYTPLVTSSQVCSGTTVTISANGIPVNRWIYRDNNTGNWITLTSGNNVQSTTNTVYATNTSITRTYRAIVSTPSCPSDTSNGVSVVINPPTYGINSSVKLSASSYQVCSNSSVNLRMMGVNGTIVGWLYKNSNATSWTLFSSTSSDNIFDYNTYTTTSITREYKALVRTAGGCQIDSTDKIQITINPLSSGFNFALKPSANNVAFCEGEQISLTMDVNAQLIQNWLYRDSANGTWIPFGYSSANASVYAPITNQVINRTFRVLLKNNCTMDSSADLTVTINPANRSVSNSINPKITGSSASVCVGNSIGVQLTGYNSSNILQWIYRDSANGSWVVNGTNSSSTYLSTSTNLTKDIVREVRAIVKSASMPCQVDTSSAVFVTFKAYKNGYTSSYMPIAPFQQAAMGTSVTIQLSNSNSVSTKWMYRTNGIGNWINGGSGTTYYDYSTVTNTNYTKNYKVVVSSSTNCTNDTTGEVSVLFKVPSVGGKLNIMPKMNAAGYCVGNTPSGNITINSTYYSISKWLYMDNNSGTWLELPYQTSTNFYDYYTSGITVPTTRSYRALIRNNETISIDSSEIVSTVISPVSRGNKNNIVPIPANTTICAGTQLNIQIPIPDNYVVQNWIYRDSTIGNWIYFSGGSGSVYDYNTNVAYNRTRYYRAIFYNSTICQYDTSGIATVSINTKSRGVNNAVVPVITSGSNTICSNSQSLSMQVTLPTGATIQRWIVRDNNGAWINAANTTTSTYYTEQMYNLAVFVPTVREYRIVFDNINSCSVDTSAAAVVTINPLIGGSSSALTPTSSLSTICEGSYVYLSLNNGNNRIQSWLYRDNSGSWNNINQTSSSFSVTPDKIAVNTVRQYKAIVYRDGTCYVDTTQTVSVNLYPVVYGNASNLTPTTSQTSICIGQSFNANVNISGGQTVKKWIYKDNNTGNWLDFTSNTNSSYLYDYQTYFYNTTQREYRAIIQQQNCALDTSAALAATYNVITYGNQLSAVPNSSQGTLCSGAAISISLSGFSGSVRKWIYKDNNGNWLDIPSSSSSYLSHNNTIVNTTTTRAYRAIIASSTCSYDSSAIYSVTINPVSNGNLYSVTPTVGTPNVCALNSSNAYLTVNTPANYSVNKWIMSDNNGAWNEFSYVTNSTTLYDYGVALPVNTIRNYRVLLLNTNTCSIDTTNAASVNIASMQYGNLNTVSPTSSRTSYCFNTPIPLNISTPSGYSIKKWIVKDNNEPWRDVDYSTTSSSFTDNQTGVSQTITRYYRVIFTNNTTCTNDSSLALAIVIKSRSAIGGNSTITPTSSLTSICTGTTASLSINPGSGNSVLKWIYSDNGAAGNWYDIVNSYNSNSISHSNTNVSVLTNRLYRAIITDTSACELDSSVSYTMTIKPIVAGLDTTRTITGVDTLCSGQSVNLTVSTGGNYVQKWIYKDNNGDWKDFSNNTATSYLYDNANNFLGTVNSRTYRALVINGTTCSADSSKTKTVNFKQKTYGIGSQVVTISSADTVCSGSTISMSTSGTVEKWLYKDGNGLWTPIANSSSYLSHSNTVVNGAVWRYYRAIITNVNNCTADSSLVDSVLIRNQQYGNNNGIVPTTSQSTYCAGNTITVSSVMPSGATFVKWIYRNGNSPWQDFSYSFSAVDYNTNIVASTSRSYRMIYSKNCSNDTTAALTINIVLRTHTTVNTLVPTAQSTSVCAGSPVNNINVNAGSGNSIVKWQYSDNYSAWMDLYIGNQNNLTDNNTYFGSTVTRRYRAVINNLTGCSFDTTGALLVTINPIAVGSSIGITPTAPSTVCVGNTATITVTPGSNNSVLRWTYNINNGGYMDWGYNTSTSIVDYNTNFASSTTKSYRAIIYQPTNCRIDTTPAVTVNFVPRTFGNDNSIVPNGATSLCYGNSTNVTVSPGSGNTIQKWIYRDNNTGNWIDASYSASVAVSNYSQVALSRVYRALIVKGNSCTIDTSAGITIAFNPRTYSTNNSIVVTSTASVCTGASIYVSASNTSNVLNWLYRDNGATWTPYYSTSNSFVDANTNTNSIINREYVVLNLNNSTCVVDTGRTDTSVINPRTIGTDNSITPTTSNNSVCIGTAINVSVNPGSGNTIQKWIYRNDNTGAWITFQNGNYNSITDYNTNVQITTIRSYRAIVIKSSNCTIDTSAALNVTISPRTVGNDNSITPTSSSNTYCSGNYYYINLNLSGGNTVQKWIVKTDNGTWVDLYKGSSTSFSEYANVVSTTTKMYRAIIIKASGCKIDTSAALTITLNPGGYGNQNTITPTGTANVCSGSGVSLSISGYTGTSVLRWLYRDNLSGNWNVLYISSTSMSDYNTNVNSTTVRSYRAIINNPAGCSIDTSGIYNVTINPLTNGVSATAAQASQSTYCTGSAVNVFINPPQGYVVNKWLYRDLNGAWDVLSYSSATSIFDYNTDVNMNSTKQYRAILRNTAGCNYDSSGTVNVNINVITAGNNNSITPTSNTPSVCSGNTAIINVSGFSGSVVKWLYRDTTFGTWYVNNTSSNTLLDNNTYTSYNKTRYYRAIVYNTANCSHDTSAAVSIAINQQLTGNAPDIVPTANSTAICSGSSITLNVSGLINGGTVTSWSYTDDGSIWITIPNSNSNTFNHSATSVTVKTTRMYRAMVLTGCNIDYTSSLSVTLDIYPTKPVVDISTTSDSLVCNVDAVSYQWKLAGANIAGATSKSYLPTENGSYTVEVGNSSGCKTISDAYIYTKVGMPDVFTFSQFNLYPNPTNGVVNIDVNYIFADKATIQVFDIVGKLVYQSEVAVNNATLNTSFDLSNENSGIYFVRINAKGESVTRKVINVR